MASSIALTRSHTLMKLLSPTVVAPISVALMNFLSPRVAAVGSFSSSTQTGSGIPMNGSDSVSGSKSDRSDSKVDVHSKECPNGHVCPLVNPFLKQGSSIPYRVMKDKEAMYARLDMPGIGKEGLRVWLEDNSLHVNGEEKGSPEECRRKYYGNIDIPQGCYKVEEIAAELKNGVLKVKIPKRKEEINVRVNLPTCRRIHLMDFWALLMLLFIVLKYQKQ